jgi:4-hydroxybenzoate polyprenyltransferase
MTALPISPARSRLVEFAADIKLSHSIFALPFALLAMVMATEVAMPGGRVRAGQVGLIVLCMVVARSFAMGMNRLLDARVDALNPRTARRAIPAGRLSKSSAVAILGGCAVAFELVTLGFGVFYGNWLPAILAMPVLAILGAYPLFKRFTRFCHFYLGFCLALAPVCAWVAIAGNVRVEPLLMACAVMCWTAGFDILYATADVESDRATGTFSIPAKLGVANALWVARLTHVACVALLATLGVYAAPLDLLWFVAVAFVTCVFVVEHAIVKPHDLSKVGLAFFTINGVISLLLGVLGILDVFL